MRFLFFILILALLSCNSGDNLEFYAAYLMRNSLPGMYCRNYLKNFETDNDLILLHYAYRDISERWVYFEDQPGLDYPAHAEIIFSEMNFKGDCEDLAVTIMSVARELGFRARFGMGRTTTDDGHIWIEIGMDKSESDKRIIETIFSEEYIHYESNYLWIVLMPIKEYLELKPEHYVYNKFLIS